ncbi:hypothetical protein [Lactococcus lactis]|uniref:hypothetical protein n=1 Tax=Lactococcus lactis TaxID=1358 RepID=UPI0022E58169|nr:hypothetical protein [Lactococcus lactis]
MEQETDSYSEVNNLIREINNLHKVFSLGIEDFLNYNLKRSVRSVVDETGINRDFLILINKYKIALNAGVSSFLDVQINFPSVRYRIKQGESISEKILYYMTANHEYGGVPLNKCLNDFLGFRILVSDLDSLYECLMSDNDLKGVVKLLLREDGSYRGLHLYFKNGKNKFFPWELQIWDKSQAEQNELSHSEHKQKRKYISLAQTYYDGNLEKEE